MLIKVFVISTMLSVIGIASVVFVDYQAVTRDGVVSITDEDLASAAVGEDGEAGSDRSSPEPRTVKVLRSSSSGRTKLLGDLSTVTTSFDGAGNRIDTRIFRGDRRLRMVMVQTNANGDRKAIVYAHIRGITTLVGRKAEEALTMYADRLAGLAEIFETRLDKERSRPRTASATPVEKPLEQDSESEDKEDEKKQPPTADRRKDTAMKASRLELQDNKEDL